MSAPTEESARLTLRGIEVFVAVVEEGSFAGGARRLRASPSSVSQQIANLETALGARLIDRDARPLTLSPAGSTFLRRALAMLDEATQARAELAALELTTLPQLRLAIVEDLDADTTPELVARLAVKLPGAAVSVHSGPSHENIAALESRAVDIVVAADQDDPPEWIERHPLLRDPYVLFTARGLLAGGAAPVERLMQAPMVRYSAGQLMGRQIERHLRRLRLAPPRRVELDSTDALFATMAKLGGWALGTSLCWLRAPQLHGTIEVAPLPFAGFSRNLSLLARRDSLGALPHWMAGVLRELLALHAVEPGVAAMPWLQGQLRVLAPPAPAEPAPAGFVRP